MKIFNKRKGYFYILSMFCLISCSKEFLEINPKGKIIANSVSDYDKLFEQSMFVQLTSNSGLIDAGYILGDDVVAFEPHYQNGSNFSVPLMRAQNLFEWKKDVYRADEHMSEISGFYQRIYTVNKVIHEVMDAEDGSETFKQQLRAEAYTHRAFAYFMLVNFFGKPYNSLTADTDPGVPLILKGDFDQTEFIRSSVKVVYDAIIKDLKSAIPHLPLKQNTANRFTKAAAEALLGKVYLFINEADKAAPLLDKAVENLPDGFLISGTVGLINYNTASPGNPVLGYVFVTPEVGSTASQGHGYPETLNAQCGITLWNGASAALLINPETYALYKPNDLRRKLFVNTFSPLAPGPAPTLPAGLRRSRAGFLGSSIGVQLPDIYLLRAEAKARINDLNGAKESLLYLRKNRMPLVDAEADIPTNREDLIRFIIEERRREFATLGFRWFDMKRLSTDPLFPKTTYEHVLYDASGNIKETYTLHPDRFQLRFSEKLMNESPGLVNNP